jgi:predicted RNA-binding Zn-ribbon protein involved in translation (DUF1610 family)
MDETLRSDALGWTDADTRPSHSAPITALRIAGACVECGRETKSLVKARPGVAAFLCPPCGREIREAA